MNFAAWIACDWGNSNLRLWALDDADRVIAERGADKGFSVLGAGDWEPLLLETCGDLLAPGRVTDVVVCGAAGSRGSWREAPYRTVPCAPGGGAWAVPAPTSDPRLAVWILPGVNQLNPPAVMRSEETQVAGFLAQEPGFDGVVCLPGTHTKWVHVSAGEVVSFMSCMTGELFDLLARQSILRRTIASEGFDEAAFLDGVARGLGHPERLVTDLLKLRAEGLLAGLDPVSGRARLSGMLVGADLGAARAYWLGREVVVVGSERLAAPFVGALAVQGVVARMIDGKAAARAGLVAAHGDMVRVRH